MPVEPITMIDPIATIAPITTIRDTSQEAANKALEEYLSEKKAIADVQADKTAKVQVAKEAQEAKDHKKIENEKFQEAKTLKADQAEKYQIQKKNNKQELEAKNTIMDAVTNADASHFHAAEVNSKAAQEKAIATIEQNTVALEDLLAARTSAAEVNRRADNAATAYLANANILSSRSETEQAVEAYHDNMAPQSTEQQTTNATEATQLAGAATLTIRQDISPAPHIDIMD
jgi:hypothetical protein